MINSPKGKQMLTNISPVYSFIEVFENLFEAIGSEWDDADSLADEVLLQLFPQTATWGLLFWEQRLGLITNVDEPLERRRGKIIAKMQIKWPMTPERMAIIIKNFIGTNLKINDGKDYTFEAFLDTDNGAKSNLEEIIKEINRLKPSHMSYHLGLKYDDDIKADVEAKKYLYDFPIVGFYVGSTPDTLIMARTYNEKAGISTSYEKLFYDYIIPLCGTIPYVYSEALSEPSINTGIGVTFNSYLRDYNYCSENLYCRGGLMM